VGVIYEGLVTCQERSQEDVFAVVFELFFSNGPVRSGRRSRRGVI